MHYLIIMNYNEFIDQCKQNPPKGFYHIHHIIPRYKGGTDDPSNLIKLSIHDHAYAHYLLAQEHDWLKNICSCCLILFGSSAGKSEQDVLRALNDDKFLKELEEQIRPVYVKNFRHKNALPLRYARKTALERHYEIIEVCPVCGKELPYDRWTCSNECELKWRSEQRAKVKRAQSDNLKKSYHKRDKVAAACKSSAAQKGKKRDIRWITDGQNNKAIGCSDPIPDGWRLGRSNCGSKVGYEWANKYGATREKDFSVFNAAGDSHVVFEEDVEHWRKLGYEPQDFTVNDGVTNTKINWLSWPWFKAHGYVKGKASEYNGNVFIVYNEEDERKSKEEDVEQYISKGFKVKVFFVHKEKDVKKIGWEDWDSYKKQGYTLGLK